MADASAKKTATAFKVSTLLNGSLLKVLESLPCHMDTVSIFPPNLKDKFISLMSKRGLFTDGNIGQILHSKLPVLDLSESDVSDVGLQIIAQKCPLLRKIDLNAAKENRTNITSQGVISLASRCQHLQTVYLRRCLAIDDEAVIALSLSCPQLRYLNIGFCHLVSDRSLHALGRHSRFLRSLNFSRANVTDEGVIGLIQGDCASQLNEIHMTHCPELTDESVEAVLQFCPNITILLFHNCPKLTDRSREALEEFRSPDSQMRQVTWTIY